MSGGAIGALFYLRVTSFRNAVLSRLTRLKQPRYLIGAVVGAAYFYWIIARRTSASRPVGAPRLPQAFPVEQLPAFATFGAALLMVFVALYWLLPRSRAALNFSEAEIAFLFPAPVKRRTLLHYRWINAQLRILFTSLLLALFSTGLLGNALLRVLGWWVLLSTLDLHAVGSSFAITRLLDRGLASLRRRVLVAGIAVVVVTGTTVAIWRVLRAPTAEDLAGPAALASYFASLLSTPPLGWLLLPAKWVVQPLLAPDLRAFLAALGPALLVYALHYVWVLRSEVSFEEASIEKAEKRAARRSTAIREGTWRVGRSERKAQRAPFRLSAVRRPEAAFLWKNLLSSASYLRPRAALIAAAVIVVGCTSITRADLDVLRNIVATFAMFGAVYTLIFGPLVARQDLRLDLPNADVLKTYPLRGWQVVLGEVLAPVAIVTVLLWLMLLAAALTFRPPRVPAWWTPGVLAPAVIAIALVLPLLSAVQVLVLNAAVVLFPAWVPLGPERGTGIDVFGQRIFFLAGLLLTTIVALLPAAIAAAAIFFITVYVVGALVAGGLALAAVLAVLLVEIGFAIAWLGKGFESFDLSAELRP